MTIHIQFIEKLFEEVSLDNKFRKSSQFQIKLRSNHLAILQDALHIKLTGYLKT